MVTTSTVGTHPVKTAFSIRPPSFHIPHPNPPSPIHRLEPPFLSTNTAKTATKAITTNNTTYTLKALPCLLLRILLQRLTCPPPGAASHRCGKTALSADNGSLLPAKIMGNVAGWWCGGGGRAKAASRSSSPQTVRPDDDDDGDGDCGGGESIRRSERV